MAASRATEAAAFVLPLSLLIRPRISPHLSLVRDVSLT